MRFQTIKAHAIEARHSLAFSVFPDKQLSLNETSAQGSLRTLLRRVFKILTHEEKNNPDKTESSFISAVEDVQEIKAYETRSLQHLEDCANATRETEAYSQYEWINKTDE